MWTNTDAEAVRAHYDADPQSEWNRLEEQPFEFELNRRFMDRYIRPGDTVLDVGGGPGRYSLYLAKRGCRVTLVDLSPGNVDFAQRKAKELQLPLTAFAANVLELGGQPLPAFDHVLLMGPLYHLLQGEQRKKAVEISLSFLKPGGVFYAAMINIMAGMIYVGRECPEQFLEDYKTGLPELLLQKKSYAGDAFTRAYFIHPDEALPFFEQFPLKKLHFLGSECMLAPYLHQLMAQPQEIRSFWYDFAEKACEHTELFPTSEHLLYIGRKRS